MTTTTTLLVWHFTGDRLRDGRAVPKLGEKLVHAGLLKLCESGLHGSVRALDALRYAPGTMVHRCELSGTIIGDTDKHVASERTILWSADATRTLHEFAVWCAERALDADGNTDPRSREALRVNRAWLDGKATDAELDAASAAARAAVRDAASDAASAAAWAASAAARAASAAAWAASAAAWAARAAARAAAWNAAWAARAAARAAAWNAAWDEQNTELERRLFALSGATWEAT